MSRHFFRKNAPQSADFWFVFLFLRSLSFPFLTSLLSGDQAREAPIPTPCMYTYPLHRTNPIEREMGGLSMGCITFV
nr:MULTISPECIES: hypothetical protein [Porphyromonas]